MWVLFIVLIALVLLGASKANALGSFSGFLPSSSGSGGLLAALTTGFPTNDTGVQVYTSDGSITGSSITPDQATWPGDDRLWEICTAVALAEGYNQGPGAAPYDLNNPGDLSPGDEAGEATTGTPQFHGGSYIIVFSVAEGGWRALRYKFNNIVTGASHVYGADWTWSQIGAKYAGNSVAWTSNVTNYLGVSESSTPAQYVNS